ncbi:hypothetical protein HPB47_009587 [Ixodes persulcatus]|uniref:Uncharacterized protein n=1 Tax=Ixodes persulcatus TaxID=34615 RepID=A0AC60P1S4_IXOPE|nr:hypothetical protein HPB47_009587 [Ixodes persulcatus]
MAVSRMEFIQAGVTKFAEETDRGIPLFCLNVGRRVREVGAPPHRPLVAVSSASDQRRGKSAGTETRAEPEGTVAGATSASRKPRVGPTQVAIITEPRGLLWRALVTGSVAACRGDWRRSGAEGCGGTYLGWRVWSSSSWMRHDQQRSAPLHHSDRTYETAGTTRRRVEKMPRRPRLPGRLARQQHLCLAPPPYCSTTLVVAAAAATTAAAI